MCSHSCLWIFHMLASFCFDRVRLIILILWLCCPNTNQLCPEAREVLLGLLSVITHALCLTRTGASLEVGVWLAGVFALWHWARSSEIMKCTPGQIPNPPRLDAGINGLIKALLFVLVDRFTRNNQMYCILFPPSRADIYLRPCWPLCGLGTAGTLTALTSDQQGFTRWTCGFWLHYCDTLSCVTEHWRYITRKIFILCTRDILTLIWSSRH